MLSSSTNALFLLFFFHQNSFSILHWSFQISIYGFIWHPCDSFHSFPISLCAPVYQTCSINPHTVPIHTLFKTLRHRSHHACVSPLSVLPPHGLHVLQDLAGPAPPSLPQPREEPQQGDSLVLLQACPQEDHGLHTGGSCHWPELRWTESLSNNFLTINLNIWLSLFRSPCRCITMVIFNCFCSSSSPSFRLCHVDDNPDQSDTIYQRSCVVPLRTYSVQLSAAVSQLMPYSTQWGHRQRAFIYCTHTLLFHNVYMSVLCTAGRL